MIFSITRAFLDNFLKVQNHMIIFLFGYLKRPKEKRSLNINYIIGLMWEDGCGSSFTRNGG